MRVLAVLRVEIGRPLPDVADDVFEAVARFALGERADRGSRRERIFVGVHRREDDAAFDFVLLAPREALFATRVEEATARVGRKRDARRARVGPDHE